MDKHLFVVFSMPEDLLDVDGIVSAQRFELSPLDPPQNGRYPYLALYEIEGDLERAREALAKARETMEISEAINPDDAHTTWYTAITGRRVRGD
jgi:hypothetical protein